MTFVPQATPFETLVETYDATGTGAVTDVSQRPMRNFSVLVVGTDAAATAWTVIIDGSLDGTVYSEIMEHNTVIGDGENLYSGTTLFPCRYFRTRCTSLTLGAATDIVVTVLGQQ
jgi:hypothetical protein